MKQGMQSMLARYRANWLVVYCTICLISWFFVGSSICSTNISQDNMFSITQQWAIISDDKKVVWLPDCKTVDGKTFVCLNKWNRQLVKFVTNKRLYKERGGSINVALFDEMLQARQEACNACVESAKVVDEGEAVAPDAGTKRRPKHRHEKARPCDAMFVDPIVLIRMPGFSDSCGEVAPISMLCLFDGLGKKSIFG
jgi:hypothetical protein